MELAKSMEYFNPTTIKQNINIIGCGSVGSTMAHMLVRFGLTNFELWDFDEVEGKNLANQCFTAAQIGQKKTEAVKANMLAVNPDVKVNIHEAYNGERLNGIVLMCVDSITVRKKIVEANKYNTSVVFIQDIRTRLEDAQIYAADMRKINEISALLDSMNFTDEEVHEITPVSACGVELGVCTTVHLICALACQNLRNFFCDKDRNGTSHGYKFFIDASINCGIMAFPV